MSHYVTFLEEGKRIFKYELFEISQLLSRKELLLKAISDVDAQINTIEKSINDAVNKQYSEEEIQKAIDEFKNVHF